MHGHADMYNYFKVITHGSPLVPCRSLILENMTLVALGGKLLINSSREKWLLSFNLLVVPLTISLGYVWLVFLPVIEGLNSHKRANLALMVGQLIMITYFKKTN